MRNEHVQKSALLGTARIIRKVIVKYPGKDIAKRPMTSG